MFELFSTSELSIKENLAGAHEDTVFARVKPSCSTVFARITLLAALVQAAA
ncbi:hypothetical protein [Desulfosporosinus sp. OT]|uniref:hypothetical protein n=1 Tax=Desulfosporosinus sp. OT TaxID=913865 RepID=UPI000223A3E7|nr:hypothetical protein [Desulfosporosinus sp. OT]EGW40661.1 hypothetical protein DOT_1408 [Desulfosporosinus sp. OT]